MELWIRTQDKKDLIKVDYISYEIAIEDKHILWYKSIDLGTYKTKERTLEILDEIQEILSSPNIHIEEDATYYMPDDGSMKVYQMPKE